MLHGICVLIALTLFCAITGATSVAAPEDAPPPAPTLTAAERDRAIAGVLRVVREGYVFPDVAEKIVAHVRDRAESKAYDAVTTGPALAEALTRDLRAVNGDRHLRVAFSPSVLPKEDAASATPPPGWLEEMREVLARDNFGFAKVEILPGNVGYVQTTYFAPPEIAGEAYAAAMNFVANTSALLLDLRASQGSMSEDALPLLCGYLFERPVHLNDFYWRSTNKTRQTWSLAYVPGRKYVNKPVYVLTSGKTFSGAEELAYDLKNLKRATLVGDTTGGGANGGGQRRADDHFSVFVPNGRAINPVTGTNWEGVGVTPDVPVPAIRAKDVAHLMALKESLAAATDERWKDRLRRAIAPLEASGKSLTKVTFRLAGHGSATRVAVAGSFNYWADRAHALTRNGDVWEGALELEPGRYTYRFRVDDRWIADPDNPVTEGEGASRNSVLTVGR